MCGICCEISSHEPHEYLKCLELLKRRGPNETGEERCGKLILCGSVLWQQGAATCAQPFKCKNVHLVFNGDIFNVDHLKPSDQSDTEWLGNRIANCENDDELIKIFQSLEGPYSIIFYNELTESFYFARDSLGRNSLLVEKSTDGMMLKSVSFYNRQQEENIALELPPLGLYKIKNIQQHKMQHEWILHAWSVDHLQHTEFVKNIETVETQLNVHIVLSTPINCAWLGESSSNEIRYDFYELVADNEHLLREDLLEFLICHEPIKNAINSFGKLLESSVCNRVQKTTTQCRSCMSDNVKQCQHAKIAILFSGGIDCTILALLAHKYVPASDQIDLINVAFAPVNAANDDQSYKDKAPDRVSARKSYKELLHLCPKRNWNLVEVDISRPELVSDMEQHIRHLIYPLTTVLDESIGAAFWYAACGHGHCKGKDYESTARVVLVGSGADELFGGYTRHRNAYKRCAGSLREKLESVQEELDRDWRRIPARNLARDDRVIADTGKTPRAPFIEEGVVHFVRSLNASQRCCFLLEEGLGDKLFLRLYGYFLGLKEAFALKKRAIQFGSKIANSKQNANDQSIYLQLATN